MKLYGFRIVQTVREEGWVTVEANSSEEAREKVLNGDYLDLDTDGGEILTFEILSEELLDDDGNEIVEEE